MKRYHVVISGRVQGVAFRARTKSTADSLGLKGWVRNVSDGSVEAVFEGKEDALKSMLDWCRQGPRLALVTNVDISEEPYRGEFKDFRIVF